MDLMKFNFALPCEDCLKNVLHVSTGAPAAISSLGADALRIRFLTESSSLRKPFFSADSFEDAEIG